MTSDDTNDKTFSQPHKIKNQSLLNIKVLNIEMQSPLFIELKYLDNISITEEYKLLNYSVILISNIMKMNIFKIDLNFKQGSITDYIAIPDFIEDVQDYIKQNIRQLMQEWLQNAIKNKSIRSSEYVIHN